MSTPRTRALWPAVPVNEETFARPPREYGILPFWFLNGDLDPDQMRAQLREFADKGMPGIILHGRFGLEVPYVGAVYLDRIRLAVDEARALGMKTWIYDEMNWPSGTADHHVVEARPDLSQRYLECISFDIRGPWFAYLTGGDSRYHDFERSTPVAAFALSRETGEVRDLTRNLSFGNVIPFEAPPGNWTLMYFVEKRADYYIDALDPEATAEFLRQGYEPYMERLAPVDTEQMPGFYTDEPAMHYFVTARNNPIVPWTRDMFRRFSRHCGYDLRRRLPDLFFDVSSSSARVRHDFYNAITDFYSDAYYRQIHEWCRDHDVAFTGHLLYEEWLRQMIRVEGNLFKHYVHFDVIGVDHLYPVIGTPDLPAEHVAMKVGSSAAHQNGSPRLICESFGGIFMDTTMQRMKWITDWEYVLGVNLLNPHGFHYTLEGPRKRDWPPSMFYQYPWWRQYGRFSEYVSRLSHLLSGGRHVADVAILWPINAMFATYRPQERSPVGERIEHDFNALTELFLRIHHDFDYLDEDVLAGAPAENGRLAVGDERHALVVVPPMAHIRLATLERLERFVAEGGRVMGAVLLPAEAFGPDGIQDVRQRVAGLFGVDPDAVGRLDPRAELGVVERRHPGGGMTAFVTAASLARGLPEARQRELRQPGVPESDRFLVEPQESGETRYLLNLEDGTTIDIGDEVEADRLRIREVVADAVRRLIEPDLDISNPEVLYLHRVQDGRDLAFLVNSTRRSQRTRIGLPGDVRAERWDPSTGTAAPIVPSRLEAGRTVVELELPPVGSAFVVWEPSGGARVTAAAGLVVDEVTGGRLRGHSAGGAVSVTVAGSGPERMVRTDAGPAAEPIALDDGWELELEDRNALVVEEWVARPEEAGIGESAYTERETSDGEGWLPMVQGGWSFQIPAEPEDEYPIPVWYRIGFDVEDAPRRLELLIDGFAGIEWRVFVNGVPCESAPVASGLDAQIRALDISELVVQGRNVIAVRLLVGGPTDGLLDLVKLVGDFRLTGDGAIAAPVSAARPAPWTEQGCPFYSGTGVYRGGVRLPDSLSGTRVFLEADAGDDVLEVTVNGRPAGVRLWPPYSVEMTDQVVPGENALELRVANTAINLLSAQPRPSGLRSAPRVVLRRAVELDLEAAE
ncbi:MAG TPA: glycosyl hydrolase [Gaiellales bacterium]|nr:glycosyl hydrolase [Gaiellales bacterium]